MNYIVMAVALHLNFIHILLYMREKVNSLRKKHLKNKL